MPLFSAIGRSLRTAGGGPVQPPVRPSLFIRILSRAQHIENRFGNGCLRVHARYAQLLHVLREREYYAVTLTAVLLWAALILGERPVGSFYSALPRVTYWR